MRIFVQMYAFLFLFCYMRRLLILILSICTDVVETKNLTLEETAAIFDGEEATAEILGHGREVLDGKHSPDEKESVEELERVGNA